jgi:hypothetical protein
MHDEYTRSFTLSAVVIGEIALKDRVAVPVLHRFGPYLSLYACTPDNDHYERDNITHENLLPRVSFILILLIYRAIFNKQVRSR